MLRPLWIVGSMIVISLPLMGMACVPAAGTKGSAKVSASCKTDGSDCTITGSVGVTWGGSSPLNTGATTTVSTSSLDANDFSLDTSGSSVSLPQNGNVTVYLTDSSTGTVQASHTFSWIRSGTVVTLANPSAVNAWAQQNGGTADTMSYHLAAFQAGQVSSGYNTLSTTSKYAGEVEASDTLTWKGPLCPLAKPNNGHKATKYMRYCG